MIKRSNYHLYDNLLFYYGYFIEYVKISIVDKLKNYFH